MVLLPTWKDIAQGAVLLSVVIITCYASIKIIDAIVEKIKAINPLKY
jgi:hypothetical protein